MARKTRFSMARKWEPCMVCRDHTIGVAQGKPVCNACNLFFRRSKPKEHEIPLCQNLCENNRFCSVIRRCRSCRMTKCLKLIWSNPSSEEESRVESSSPVLNQSKLFENMSMWNRERERTFLNYKVQKGIEISVEEVMRNGTGKNLIPIQSKTFLEWSFISQLTSIVFLMKLPFYEDLSEDDQKSFIKAYRFKSAMFFLAMHCFKNQIDQLQYPNGTDIFSNKILACPWINILDETRTRLIRNLKELNVTMEEFYAMSSLFVCNPLTVDNLSVDGQQTLMQAQFHFQALLINLCCISDPGSGHLRCDKLVRVDLSINTTHTLFDYAIILSEIPKEGVTKKVEMEDKDSVLYFE
ncbi:unnamed protein product [Caenorhabditis brenneri]